MLSYLLVILAVLAALGLLALGLVLIAEGIRRR